MICKNISKILSTKDFGSSKFTKRNDDRIPTVPLCVFHLLGFCEGRWLLLPDVEFPCPNLFTHMKHNK